MRIIFLYIAKSFLRNLWHFLVAAICIYLAVDIIGSLAKYIDASVELENVIQLYLYSIPEFIALCIPVAVLTSSIFTIGQLAKNHELVALKSHGISLYIILSPILILSFLISFIMILCGEFVIPYSNTRRADIKKTYIERNTSIRDSRFNNFYSKDKFGRRILIDYLDWWERAARRVMILSLDETEIIHRIDAQNMYWRDGKWILQDVWRFRPKLSTHSDGNLPAIPL